MQTSSLQEQTSQLVYNLYATAECLMRHAYRNISRYLSSKLYLSWQRISVELLLGVWKGGLVIATAFLVNKTVGLDTATYAAISPLFPCSFMSKGLFCRVSFSAWLNFVGTVLIACSVRQRGCPERSLVAISLNSASTLMLLEL